MRRSLLPLALVALTASPLLSQEPHEAAKKPGMLEPHYGLMTWTIMIFVVLLVLLKLFAWSPILEAVRGREKALTDAMAAAEKDRADAAKLLADQKAALDASRAEAQRYIAEGRATAEAMRGEMLEQTRQQQSELLDRARKEIETEKTKAID